MAFKDLEQPNSYDLFCRTLTAVNIRGGIIEVNNTAFVDPNFGNNTSAQLQTSSKPYKTISAAIAAAAPHATESNPYQIQILPGTYNEDITLRDFVNLLGISSLGYGATPPGSEILINGQINDSLIVNGFPNITCLSISKLGNSVLQLSSGSLLTFTGCNLNCTMNEISTCYGINSINGTNVVFSRCNIELNCTVNTLLTYTAINIFVSGVGTSFILDNSIIGLVLAGSGVPVCENIHVENVGNVNFVSIESYNSSYSIGFEPPGPTSCTSYSIFHLDNSSVISENDMVQVIQVPATMPMYLANLNSLIGPSEVNICNMFVDLTLGNPSPRSQVHTLNNNGSSTATGYFNNIRFRGISGLVPSQTPSNALNIFKQYNVLVDDQLGGQDLSGLSIVSSTPYNVLQLDSVILYNGVSPATINLPLANNCLGRKLNIKNTLAVGNISVTPTGGNNIDLNGLITLTPNTNAQLISDGINTWWTL